MCRRLAVKDCHWVGLLLYFEFVFVCLCVGTFLLVKEFGVVLLPNCFNSIFICQNSIFGGLSVNNSMPLILPTHQLGPVKMGQCSGYYLF